MLPPLSDNVLSLILLLNIYNYWARVIRLSSNSIMSKESWVEFTWEELLLLEFAALVFLFEYLYKSKWLVSIVSLILFFAANLSIKNLTSAYFRIFIMRKLFVILV